MVIKRLWQIAASMILLALLFSCGSPVQQPTGPTTWQKFYGGSSDDIAYSVQQTSDGKYIVAGYTGSFGKGYDVYILKLSSDGTILE